MGQIKILYVEDEDNIRENTKRPLQYLCDELYLAKNGQDGLEKYKQYKPDIVISDIKMPVMNGIEMAKLIKQIQPNQHIIFTTAHSESAFFMDAIEMHVDGYILKPIDYELLENKIRLIIDQIILKQQYHLQQELLNQQELEMLAQAKNAQMGELIGNIAHQWRQPLSIITTAASGIQIRKKMGIVDEKYEEELLEAINQNGQYLSTTIDKFTNYVNEQKVIKKVIIQDRINIALDIVGGSLSEYGIKVINNYDEKDPIEVKIIIGELSQVIINIINNAKDILLHNNIDNKLITIDLEKTNQDIIISIQDNGGGIPLDIIDKIFDPYFTTKHKSQGTGLGLHMSKTIIEKNINGKLSCENRDDGAVFYIKLPLYTDQDKRS